MGETAGRHPPWPVRHVRDAVLVPVRIHRAGGIPFRFGGFDADGAVLDDMRLRRFALVSHDPAWPEAITDTITAPCVYGGFVQDHFGHFLLEGLARLWALRRLPDLPILWHGSPAAPWQRDLVSRVGLDPARFITIDRPLRVRSLLLPEPGFVIGQHFDSRQVDALAVEAAMPAAENAQGARLWLSRGGLRPARKRIDGEAAVEAILADAGWRIFRPEAHAVADQIAALARARVVAGVDGSAFHALGLLRGFTGQVVMVARRANGRGISANHQLICGAHGIALTTAPGLLTWSQGGPGAPLLRFADPVQAAAAIASACAGAHASVDRLPATDGAGTTRR